MADRPILFSAPMVRALLDGRKTQTRRLLTLSGYRGLSEFGPSDTPDFDWHFRRADKVWCDLREERLQELLPYAPGDRLWVKEAWRVHRAYDDLKPSDLGGEERVWPELDRDNCDQHGRYRHGRFMPRWASRLTLIVTGVRVQRLQEISEADILAEGAPLDPNHRDCTQDGSNPYMCLVEGRPHTQSPRAWYHRLWDSLHVTSGVRWEDDPWIVAVSFGVKRGNIDNLGLPA